MQALIYQTPQGYDIRTCTGSLYSLIKGGGRYIVKNCGQVGDGWRGTGKREKGIPNQIKKIFFNLNKQK